MSPPRRYPYRKLDKTERTFVETRLAAGHSPKAILQTMNAMTSMTPEEIRKSVEVEHTAGGGHGHTAWEKLAGRNPYNIEDVRRAYDAMRKSRNADTVAHNALRRQNLNYLYDDDDRRRIAHELNPSISPEWKRGNTRTLADAGMIWRLTNNHEIYDELVRRGIKT